MTWLGLVVHANAHVDRIVAAANADPGTAVAAADADIGMPVTPAMAAEAVAVRVRPVVTMVVMRVRPDHHAGVMMLAVPAVVVRPVVPLDHDDAVRPMSLVDAMVAHGSVLVVFMDHGAAMAADRAQRQESREREHAGAKHRRRPPPD